VDFKRLRRLDSRLHSERSFEPSLAQSRVALVLAGLCGLFMLTVAIRQYGPTVHPDEFGFLTNGQALIGHDEAAIPTGSFYPAGYGIVTGLGALVSGSISGAYRFALLTNVVLAVLTAWYAGRLAQRGFGASRHMALVITALVFVVPGTIVSAMFSWAETASRLAFLLFVGFVLRASKARSNGLVVGLGLFTGLMPALHGRFILLLPIVCLLFAWWWRRKEISFITAGSAVAVTAVAYMATHLLNKFVKTAVYTTSYDQENRLLERLVNPNVWPALLRTMVGQSWYLIASSCGLIGIAIFFIISRVVGNGGRKTIGSDAERVTLLVVFAAAFAIIFTGGLQLLYGNRGDHLIYGRYVEMMVPALLVISCVALERTSRLAQRAWLVTALSIFLVAAFYVLIDFGDGVKGSHYRDSIVYPNIVGIDIARYIIRPGLITFGLLFATVALVLWALARRNGAVAVLTLVALFAVSSMYSGQNSILTRTARLEATNKTLQLVRDSGAARVGFDIEVRNDRSYYYMRYKLHPIRVVRFNTSGPNATIPSIFSCIYGVAHKPPSDGEWTIVATEKAVERVLWQRADKAHC
jgi:hypothetical protein